MELFENLYFPVILIVGLSFFLRKYWMYRKENELLNLTLKEKDWFRERYDFNMSKLYLQLGEQDLKLKKQDDIIKALRREHKPVSAVYGFVALQRFEEITAYQIKCITMALERIPEFHSRYDNLERELERLLAFDVEINGAKRAYSLEFGFSTEHALYRNQNAAVLSRLLRGATSGPCLLEDFLQISPIETTFWNNGSASQKKKLERELAKLKNKFPEISENNLRSTMVYAYCHFKRDIFSISSRKLEKMVERLIYGIDEMENAGNVEEPELCSICLEEMNNTDIVSLVCNHVFHPEEKRNPEPLTHLWFYRVNLENVCRSFESSAYDPGREEYSMFSTFELILEHLSVCIMVDLTTRNGCINPWLQHDNRCPLCRQPIIRNTQR